MSKQVQDHFKPVYEELFKKLETTFTGAFGEVVPRLMMSVSEEEREATFKKLWDLGGFNFLSASRHNILLASLTWLCSKQLQGSHLQ